jgi:hypothetical protein
MAAKRKIEVFSAGCPACQDTVALVQRIACPSCDVSVLDMNDPKVASRAKSLGIRSVPAVVIAASCPTAAPGEGLKRPRCGPQGSGRRFLELGSKRVPRPSGYLGLGATSVGRNSP